MNLRRLVGWTGAAALAAGLLTCKGEPVQPPTPGWVDLQLTTPNPYDAGGILFVVGGGEIDSVRSSFPYTFLRRESGSSFRVVIVGSLRTGVIGQILVPDPRSTAAYTASVVEVAAGGTYVQRALAGYALTVAPAP